MSLEDTIKEIIEEEGLTYHDKGKNLYTTCPSCGKDDKLSIIKQNGATICYRGSCDFGKAWFQDWLSLTAGISIKEAKKRIYGDFTKYKEKLELSIGKEKQEEVVEPIEWPSIGFLKINEQDAVEGLIYLNKRGVSQSTAIKYDIRYSPWTRRVILPISSEGKVYGWQGRAIDNVDKQDRMRNNTNFRKDQMFMFNDSLFESSHLLLFEGPFDALKFSEYGGIICSMGKDVSKKQIDLINQSNAEVVYLGLDEDAAETSTRLTKIIEKRIKILTIPESCKERCESVNKKADFGECSPEEIRQAFENAKDLADGHIFINLHKFF